MKSRSFHASVAIVVALGSVGAVVACNTSDDPEVVVVSTGDAALGDDALGDDDGDAAYTGPTQGGTVVLPPMDGSSAVMIAPTDAATSIDTVCCNLHFVYDPSQYPATVDAGDAGGSLGSQVYLTGDAYPLADGTLLPMSKQSDGTWTVDACIPHAEYLRYRFYLGSTDLVPGDPDAGSTPTYVCDPNQPMVSDGLGGCYDTFGPVDDCSSVDASTGMLTTDQ